MLNHQVTYQNPVTLVQLQPYSQTREKYKVNTTESNPDTDPVNAIRDSNSRLTSV